MNPITVKLADLGYSRGPTGLFAVGIECSMAPKILYGEGQGEYHHPVTYGQWV